MTYPAGTLPALTYTYDNYGRVKTAGDSKVTYTYQYDDLDNITDFRTTYAFQNTLYNDHTQYTYNRDGSRNTLNNSRIGTISYSYFANGNVKQVVYPWQDSANPVTQAVTYTYDDNDRLTRQATNALTTTYTYDARGELLSLTNTSLSAVTDSAGNANGPGKLIAAYTNMKYDGAGNRLRYDAAYHPYASHPLPTTSGGMASGFDGTYVYTYDDKDRLASETVSRPGVANNTFYSYGYTNYAFTYQANEANNLTTLRSQTDIGYNADNQPTSAISSTVFGFDDDGNTRTYNNVPGYTFDVENRISGYGGGPVISYNPDGLRGVNATSGSPVFYFYDGDRLLYEVGYAGDTMAYGWGAAGLSQKYVVGSSAVVAYAYDPQGSVVSSYDDYANWRDLYFYDAFGQLRAGYASYFVGGQNLSAGLDKFYGDGFDNVGFGGQWGYYTDYPSFGADYGRGRSYHVGPDQATGGRLLLGHRYYDPLLARFLSRDPIGYEGGINLYAYCDNNPIMGIDPSGLQVGDDSLSNSFWAAMRAGNYEEAGGVLKNLADLGKNKLYDICLSAYVRSPVVAKAIQTTLALLDENTPRVTPRNESANNIARMMRNAEGSGEVICELQADRIRNFLIENGVKESSIVIKEIVRRDGKKFGLKGAQQIWNNHVYVEVDGQVIDSLNKGFSLSRDQWKNQFPLPTTAHTIFDHTVFTTQKSFGQVYKIIKRSQ